MYGANNYGYSPYGRYMQQPMEQPIQNNYNLPCKKVESIDIVKNMEIPLDGSMSYFVLADNSAVVSKQLQLDGTSKIQIYKLVDNLETKAPTYLTIEDLEDIKEELKDIKSDIKELRKKKKDE